MDCPNCNAPRLKTTETFQNKEQTIRTKKCLQCKWTFTSVEEISEKLVIPDVIRRTKKKQP